MLLQQQVETIKLTQYIMEQFWQKNYEPLIEHANDNILWIGPLEDEYVYGKKAMVDKIMEKNDERPLVYLDDQEYEGLRSEGNISVVVGKYRAYTKLESGVISSEKQRVTFMWERVKKDDEVQLLITHIHISNIFHTKDDDKLFSSKDGRENYEYIQKIIAEHSQDETITIRDHSGVRYTVNYSDIMYVVAEDNFATVYIWKKDEVLRVRSRLVGFVKDFPDIKPGRKYCINKNYVKYFKSRKLIMADGREFAIPRSFVTPFKNAMKM
jgi:hypothetical protein